MARSDLNQLKREAVVPLPASRRLSYVLGLSVLLVGFTAAMDAFLWGAFNQPLTERREAAREYEVRSLKADYARMAVELQQTRERADALSSALHSCESSFDSGPEFATPCRADEVRVQTETGQFLCLPGPSLREPAMEDPVVEPSPDWLIE